mmetsp:Transcript_46908/g.73215  ORF Transcript_46908/g.73215 Transcript_46908/m.73215 type:complete len:368 (-) Transcript_46908:290-1393(-)
MRRQKIDNSTSCVEGRAVYFRGIPPTWTAARFEEYITASWQVESINFLPSKASQPVRAAFVNFFCSQDAEEAVNVCDGIYVEDDSSKSYWLGCSLKRSANQKADVAHQVYSVPSEVLSGFLFLGNRECASNVEYLRNNGIDHILSIYDDEDAPSIPSFTRWLHLRAKDSEEEDISRLFGPACEFIENARVGSGKILVHCIAGRSRSVSVVLAYLMNHRRMNLEDAFVLVKEKRPFAWPNDSFWKQLQVHEAKIFASSPELPDQSGPSLAHKRGLSQAQFSTGTLSRASQLLLKDFQRDLDHFSGMYHVMARIAMREDRVDLDFFNISDDAISSCMSELSQIFSFYGFREVRWSPPNFVKENALPIRK